MLFQRFGQFLGLDEHLPHMHIGRKESGKAPLLRHLDDHKLTERCAINGIVEKDSILLEHTRNLANHGVPIRNVLQHVAAIDHLERLVLKR